MRSYAPIPHVPARIDPRRRRWYAGIQAQEPKKRPQDRQFEVNTGFPSSGRALLERGYVGLVQLLDTDPLMLGPPDEGCAQNGPGLNKIMATLWIDTF